MFQSMSKVTQGGAGLGAAIGYFCSRGVVVCVPLLDNQDYDLVIDEDGFLKKVQVKTTGYKAASGNFVVQLKSVRSNKTSNKISRFDPTRVDYLFILTSDGDRYLLPTDGMQAGVELTLTKERAKYRV